VFVLLIARDIIWSNNIEEATEIGSNFIPVKTGKRREFLGDSGL